MFDQMKGFLKNILPAAVMSESLDESVLVRILKCDIQKSDK